MDPSQLTKSFTLLFFGLLLFSTLPLVATASSELSLWGDWVIEGDVTKENETLIVHGDVKDVYITVSYDPSDYELGGYAIKMYHWDEDAREWIEIQESGADARNNIVWAELEHFTIFAPMAEKIAKTRAEGLPTDYFLVGALFASVFIIGASTLLTMRRRRKNEW